jgi:hypothetical protein
VYIYNIKQQDMKKLITTTDQKRINELLDARKQKQSQVQPIKKSLPKEYEIERMQQYEWDNSIGKQTAGLTHHDHQQLMRRFS